MGAYKKGASQGADSLLWNMLHDGDSINTMRVQERRCFEHPRISFVGAGHPDTTPLALKRAVGDDNESDIRGAAARYLISMKQGQPFQLTTTPPRYKLDAVLMELYEVLATVRVGALDGNRPHDDMPYVQFDAEAQQGLVRFHNEVIELVKSANEEVIRAQYPKMEANAIRIAGVLHVVNSLLANPELRHILAPVPQGTFEVAIDVAKYYARQAEALFRLNRSGDKDPVGARILAFLTRKAEKGGDYRDIQQGTKYKQPVVRPAVATLQAKGLVYEQDGRFYAGQKLIHSVEPVVSMLKSAATLETRMECDDDERVGDVDPFEGNPDIQADIDDGNYPWDVDAEQLSNSQPEIPSLSDC
jgi:hypothetical protein